MKDDEPFALGGVWCHWRVPDSTAEMDIFAVVTTAANELFVEKTGHDRMPVIIKRSDYQRWNPEIRNTLPSISFARSIQTR